ncbi:hypothetical protein G6F31_015117 [Rhizopus arrhizus]|nr:hypothetical protein G6F31_015117 [Rhizopus arrhizus]
MPQVQGIGNQSDEDNGAKAQHAAYPAAARAGAGIDDQQGPQARCQRVQPRKDGFSRIGKDAPEDEAKAKPAQQQFPGARRQQIEGAGGVARQHPLAEAERRQQQGPQQRFPAMPLPVAVTAQPETQRQQAGHDYVELFLDCQRPSVEQGLVRQRILLPVIVLRVPEQVVREKVGDALRGSADFRQFAGQQQEDAGQQAAA